jgi:hypothetical protein
MERVGQHVDLGCAPFHKLSVKPDLSVAIVEGHERHAAILPALERHKISFLAAQS